VRARVAIDLVLSAALLGVAGLAARDLIAAADLDVRRRAVEREARALNDAFDAFRRRTGAFPDGRGEDRFDPATLDPLRVRGYYDGPLLEHLAGGRVDGYDSPDDRGTGREFWVEMTLDGDSASRWIIAHSDDAPSGGGVWLEGVYAWRHGRWEPR